MSSTIEVQKVCAWCGAVFTARKTTTEYCSHRCSSTAYKARKRGDKVQQAEARTQSLVAKRAVTEAEAKIMLSVSEAARLLGVTRPTVYRYLEKGALKFARVDSKVLIRRGDIEELFDSTLDYRQRIAREQISFEDYYTADQIVERFDVDRSWLFRVAKQKQIPKTFHRGRALYSREHIDLYFTRKPTPITEWLTVEDACGLFGITRDALYHYVKQHSIPKLKEGRYIKISKSDLLKILKPQIS